MAPVKMKKMKNEQNGEMEDGKPIPIPEPRGIPFLGHVNQFMAESAMDDLHRMADIHGGLYRIRIGNESMLLSSSYEVSKNYAVRTAVNNGLFTADSDDPTWAIAHRILIPAFGPVSIRAMFPQMHELAGQLALKWARHGPSAYFDVSSDFTRLTLDTIALCAMGFRFNSFYHDEMHPFVAAMNSFLLECDKRSRRPPFLQPFFRKANKQAKRDIELMRRTSDEVVNARREAIERQNKEGKGAVGGQREHKDLMTAMLEGVDPKTGARLSPETVTDNLITFLVAGHETTSGLLSFVFYELLRHPECYQKAQAEVDRVVGRDVISVDHLSRLPYVTAVLRETLRIDATIPAFSVQAKHATTVAGHAIPAHEPVIVLLARTHSDATVWGPDARVFRPERMLDANLDPLMEKHPNCFKPFGNGVRACIGRPFAMQESLLAAAMLLQNFNFVMEEGYELRIFETLTVKPKDFRVRALLRHGMTPEELETRLAGKAVAVGKEWKEVNGESDARGTPLRIYFGSNCGTCESLAKRLAADARRDGYNAHVDDLDAAKENLKSGEPVVIVTASYEGLPPDNAAHFVEWVESLEGKEMNGVRYAVYGCGHREWATTFHRIPKLLDASLERLGGTRLVPMGSTDAAERDMFGDFEAWQDELLLPALKKYFPPPSISSTTSSLTATDAATTDVSSLNIIITTPRALALHQGLQQATVASTRSPCEGDSTKRHVEISLPDGMRYRTGDYLAVLPLNPRETVDWVLRRFGIVGDSVLSIDGNSALAAVQGPISVADLLSGYVELGQPATPRNINVVADASENPEIRKKLTVYSSSPNRPSILSILEEYPSINIPFHKYLGMLPPMRVRQYSISSSPLVDPSSLSLTYSLLDTPAIYGNARHLGVATSYLSALKQGDKLHVGVRGSSFRLPTDLKEPLIGVCAGSGIAPFRGFIMERSAIVEASREAGGMDMQLGPMLLFFGCRSPNSGDLYAEDLKRWEELGVVDVRRAYSRQATASEGCRYVHDRVRRDKEDVVKLWKHGASVYVCGRGAVGRGTEDAMMEILGDGWQLGRSERFVSDVFD